MKIFEVLYALELDSEESWSNRAYIMARNIDAAWTEASQQFRQDRRIVSIRELPHGLVLVA